MTDSAKPAPTTDRGIILEPTLPQRGDALVGHSEGGSLILGRNQICGLNEPLVSRQHAVVRFTSGGWVIEDLGSTNGTFVDGNYLTTAVPLHDRSAIVLAKKVIYRVWLG